jgi:exonuclease III
VSTIALRKFNFFKFLLLTILIVNVQIKGLIDAKPLWGGAYRRPGYEDPQECRKISVFYYYVNPVKKSKYRTKVKCDDRKSKRTLTRQTSRTWRWKSNRADFVEGQISGFFNLKRKVESFIRSVISMLGQVKYTTINLPNCGEGVFGMGWARVGLFISKTFFTNILCLKSVNINYQPFKIITKFGQSNFVKVTNLNEEDILPPTAINKHELSENKVQISTAQCRYLNKIINEIFCVINSVLKKCFIKCSNTNKYVLKQIKRCLYYYLNCYSNPTPKPKSIKPTIITKKQKGNPKKAKVSNAMIRSLIIFLLLICHGVEINPGPPSGMMEIVTYNCNGLGQRPKLKRLLTKLEKKVNNGAVIFLQETHLVNTEYLKLTWKNKLISNCKRSNSAGVIILFNNKYDVQHEYLDESGRQIVAVLKQDDKTLVVSNAYFPNDHKEGIVFAESLYLKILEAQAIFPENITICGGDYNVCMTKEDSVGRNETRNENLLADVIRNNNKVTELVDAYRTIHTTDGFTWRRGNKYSRLDYIFISNFVVPSIKKAETNWAFDTSDHAAVIITIMNQEIKKGPGIARVNTKIIEDPKKSEEIANEIKEMMLQTDENWNPHLTLEFLKVAIRSVISNKVSENRKQVKSELEEMEDELNYMENMKINVLKNTETPNQTERLENINKAINTLKGSTLNLMKKLEDKTSFYTKAKWFEYGEKSNKYFLNLNKQRQNQKLINKIKDGEKEYTGQDQVSKGITGFYRSLYEKRTIKMENEREEDRTFYDNCPKLSSDQKNFMDKPLNVEDLKLALATCKDSAPGPDGIPYLIYKRYWNIAGPIILNSWTFSLKIGKLPPSHLESVITILPKDGKDTRDIKNWRPITLSNCDSKIITKAIALKAAKVLDSIIDPSQTAYVPGRTITDNLRSNFFYKNYCRNLNKDSVLISLDAKKAFDSVDHKYIEDTLSAYGFGHEFLKVFKTLYNGITARILVNGYASEKINIERGVKQGDALSCALFILCIDPLLRNINKNKNIKKIDILRRNKVNEELNLKAAAYADDISVICEKDNKSIQNVFNEYERLTLKSGLELNADKTEILVLNNMKTERMKISYMKKTFDIQTVKKIKICGLYYCVDLEEEYKENVLEKINRLTYKIKTWIPRHLTMEGKTLIVKTFGLSQIIYNMQAYNFKKAEITLIERSIFKFLWSTTENKEGIDRIKRSIMKNDYKFGGMRVTDVECLNRSLKLRQFIRASNANHVIAKIQSFLTTKSGKTNQILQEYSNITKDEPICQIAQETINLLTDYNRRNYNDITEDEFVIDKNLINEVSSINIIEYLTRKNHPLLLCVAKPLLNNGINSLGDLTQAYEYENDENLSILMKKILSVFPIRLVEISRCFIEGINEDFEDLKYMLIDANIRKNINIITVKELQNTLKKVLNKNESTNFDLKLGIQNFDEENITTLRKKCQNAKFRNLYFRLIHNDFFTHVRMKKYKMTQTDCCPRCGMTETSKHLLWECQHVREIWSLYNKIMTEGKVNTYEEIFQINNSHSSIMIKMKTIQELIQIDRPKNWNMIIFKEKIQNLVNIERYIALNNGTITKFNNRWKNVSHLFEIINE